MSNIFECGKCLAFDGDYCHARNEEHDADDVVYDCTDFETW